MFDLTIEAIVGCLEGTCKVLYKTSINIEISQTVWYAARFMGEYTWY